MYEVRRYMTSDGKDIVSAWLHQLRDPKAKIAIGRRINRMELGNLGDHKVCGRGVWEMRVDIGPGYRVYCAIAGSRLIVLLAGGDKSTQSADIRRAQEYWIDWQKRS